MNVKDHRGVLVGSKAAILQSEKGVTVPGQPQTHRTGVTLHQDSVGSLSGPPHRQGALPRGAGFAAGSRKEPFRIAEDVLWDI